MGTSATRERPRVIFFPTAAAPVEGPATTTTRTAAGAERGRRIVRVLDSLIGAWGSYDTARHLALNHGRSLYDPRESRQRGHGDRLPGTRHRQRRLLAARGDQAAPRRPRGGNGVR